MASIAQCEGLTRSGGRCSRRAGVSGYCWQHEKKSGSKEKKVEQSEKREGKHIDIDEKSEKEEVKREEKHIDAEEKDEKKQRTTVVAMQRKGGEVVQDSDVYIGRQCNMAGWRLPKSIWHNPFSVKDSGSAEEAIRRYEEYIRGRPELLKRLPELKGKRLGCWCKKPKTPNAPCHGDVLLKLIDELYP